MWEVSPTPGTEDMELGAEADPGTKQNSDSWRASVWAAPDPGTAGKDVGARGAKV